LSKNISNIKKTGKITQLRNSVKQLKPRWDYNRKTAKEKAKQLE
jgi:hypothetical protein